MNLPLRIKTDNLADTEAEGALLWGVCQSPERFDDVSMLEPDDFSDRRSIDNVRWRLPATAGASAKFFTWRGDRPVETKLGSLPAGGGAVARNPALT